MKSNKQKRSNNKGFAEIFGRHAVNAALLNPVRKHQKLFISINNKDVFSKNLADLVPEINHLHNKEMFKLFGNENTHQGFVLRTSKLLQPKLEKILADSQEKKSNIVIILDQLTDPNNIGAIMRSAALFNCKTIIVSNNNAPNITGAMAKTASGAIEIINYISVVNLSRAIIQFKKNGYWIYGFDSNKKNNISKELDLAKKCVLVFGAEGKGLRELTKKECDTLVSIPMQTKNDYNIDSLNVSNACSIALFEHFKKNQ